MTLIYINAFICLIIAIRLFTFNRQGYKYKRSFALLAWAMICSSLGVCIFSYFNFIERAYVAQTLMNLLTAISLFKARGNIAKVARPLTSNSNGY